MTSIYLVRTNSNENEINSNYKILKDVRIVTNCPNCNDYTLDDYKQEMNGNDTFCLYVPHLSDETFKLINTYITDISDLCQHYGTIISSKN